MFVNDVQPVWNESFRVLKKGGHLLGGFSNPISYCVDPDKEKQGELVLKYPLPYSDLTSITEEERVRLYGKDETLAFGHLFEDIIGGQLFAGFHLTGFYEDSGKGHEEGPLDKLMPTFFATKAYKPL